MRCGGALFAMCLVGIAITACGPSDRPADSRPPLVAITSPIDDDTLQADAVRIQLAVQNIVLRPAGTMEDGTGHHHLFINRAIVAEGEVIPAEDDSRHLGAGQSELMLESLSPGEYTIIAVLGDHAHVRIPGSQTDTVRLVIR